MDGTPKFIPGALIGLALNTVSAVVAAIGVFFAVMTLTDAHADLAVSWGVATGVGCLAFVGNAVGAGIMARGRMGGSGAAGFAMGAAFAWSAYGAFALLLVGVCAPMSGSGFH